MTESAEAAPRAPAPPPFGYPTFLPLGGIFVTVTQNSQMVSIGIGVTVIVTNCGANPVFANVGSGNIVADNTSPCVLPGAAFNLDGTAGAFVAVATLAGSSAVSIVWGT